MTPLTELNAILHSCGNSYVRLGILQAQCCQLKLLYKLEIRELDVLPGKTRFIQGKFVKFISPVKGYFRETYKSQNINPIFATPKFILGIIQIIVKKYINYFFSAQFNKLIRTISISDPEVRDVCKAKLFALMLVYTSFPWERNGSVVECLTRDRGAAGSSLTGLTALCP